MIFQTGSGKIGGNRLQYTDMKNINANTKINFLKTLLSDKQVGAVARTSKYVIRAILKNLGKKPANLIIEYGPGDGVMTRELLKHLSSKGSLVVIESNTNFNQALKKISDPRLKIINGKVQNIIPKFNRYGLSRIDAAISGIPFSMIGSADRDKIVKNTFHHLKAGGNFIVYQYSPLMLQLLKRHFKKVKISFEVRNIPPCFIMCGQKTKLAQSRSSTIA